MATSRSSAAKRPPVRGKTQTKKPFGPETSPLNGVPVQYHTWIFIGLILLSLLIFFGGVIFSDKIFAAGDFLSWESFRPFLDAMDKKGEPPLWIPYIFSGMPAFASYLVTGDRWWDLTMKIIYSGEHIFGFINYPVMRVVMHYFIYGVGMYLLMRTRKAARSTSAFVALAAIFSTWIIIYIMIGHNTKIMTLMAFPYIFLCLERLIKRWSFLYAGLLIVAVHVLWEAAQLNTAFYGACAVGIYLLIELIGSIATKGNVVGVLRAGLLVGIAALFTLGMGLDRVLAVQEYVPYSTRGAQAITEKGTKEADDDASHGYDYATNWSFSPEEMITYVVPNYFGSGNVELPPDVLSTIPEQYAQYRRNPFQTYWGQMPFTDAAHYMGISVLILGLWGFWMNRRSKFAQSMLAIGLFGLLLSFGKNFPVLYDLFYNWIPSFNKLRAPSQSLVLLEFAFPILAGMGIESLIAMHKAKDNPAADRSILYSAFGFGGFMVLLLIIVSSAYNDALAASQKAVTVSPKVMEYVSSMTTGDILFSAFFGVATLLLMYYYVQHRVTPFTFKLALFFILIFDLWRVAYRPMDTQPASVLTTTFATTDVDTFLKGDTSQFRILDQTTHPNYPAYQFHEHILGYHAAKLRNYQDLLDVAGNTSAPTSPLALNLLNTKYIISPQPIGEGIQPIFTSKQKQAMVYENTQAMPRAWFVNRVEVADGMAVLNKIKNNEFDPRDVAFVPDSSKAVIAGINPAAGTASPAVPTPSDSTGQTDSTATAPTPATMTGGGTVSITKYEPLHIAMNVDAPGPEKNFLVISEIFYPPSWRATIDGKPAQIVQTDYLLRGIVVPAGKHTIEMNYVSEGFEAGKWVSLALNIAAFAAIAVGIIMERGRPHEDIDPEHDGPLVDEDDV